MNYTISVGAILELGQRPNQEDNIYPMPADGATDHRAFVLCDGMGGHARGEVASGVVSRVVGQRLSAISAANQSADLLQLRLAIDAAYDELDRQDPDPDERPMGTTLALLALGDEGATMCHIGDSRIYHLRPGREGAPTRIMHRTRDHSVVEAMQRAGIISEEQALVHPQRNRITRAMQPHMPQRDYGDVYETGDVRAGDVFLLCSDGLLEHFTDDLLRYDIAWDAPVGDLRQQLIQQTQDNRDNHSALIIKINDISV